MKKGTISKVYDYKDANETLIYQVVRYEPKSFTQRRPYNTGFAWGLSEGWFKKGQTSNDYFRIKDASPDRNSQPHPSAVWFDAVEPILYRYPELLEGIKNGKTIYLLEGEKDVDNLNGWGFITTTCLWGAGKWRRSYTNLLSKCNEVIIIADKDVPGRQHAETIASRLSLAEVSVKVLEMPDINGTQVKDFSDWMTAGGNPGEFTELVKRCPAWTPNAKVPVAVPAIPKVVPQSLIQPELQKVVTSYEQPVTQPELQEIIQLFGEPYYSKKERRSSRN